MRLPSLYWNLVRAMPERIGTRFLIFLQAHRWILMLLPALALLTVFFLIPLLNLGRIAFFPHDRLMIYIRRWTMEYIMQFLQFFRDPSGFGRA